MKNIFKSVLLLAAVSALFACSKDQTEDLPGQRPTKQISVTTDITRTSLNGDRTKLSWVEGDQFGIFTDVATDKNIASDSYTSTSTGFIFTVDGSATTIYAYYPFATANKDKTATTVSIGPATQQTQQTAGTFEGTNYPMVAKGTINGTNVSLTFKPIVCALALNIYGAPNAEENVTSVSFTSSINCCGYNPYDLTDDNAAYSAYSKTATLTLGTPFSAVGEKPADKQQFANQIYLFVAKANYPAGSTFTVNTDKNTYVFTTSGELDCSTSDVFAMNLNLAKGYVAPTELGPLNIVTTPAELSTSETYYIGGNNQASIAADNKMYMWKGTIDSGNKAARMATTNALPYENYLITGSEIADIAEVTLEAGETANKFYIKVGDLYLTSNGTTTALSMNATKSNAWEIISLDGKDGFGLVYNNARIFVNSSGTTAIRCYNTDKTYNGIYFFKKSAPQVIVPETEYKLAADDTQTHSFTASVMGEGAQLSTVTMTQDSESSSWLTALFDNTTGEVAYEATNNDTGSIRTAILTFSIPEGKDVVVTVTQAAAAQVLTMSDVTATSTATSITLEWSAVEGATAYGYKFMQGTTEVANSTTTALTITIPELSPETSYTYSVWAIGDGVFFTDSAIKDGTATTASAGTVSTSVFDFTINPVTANFTSATEGAITLTGLKGGYSGLPKTNKDGHLKVYAKNDLNFKGATITKIVITATSNNIKTWADQSSSNKGTITITGSTTATWEGSSTDLTLRNTASAQAQVTKIEVTYQ